MGRFGFMSLHVLGAYLEFCTFVCRGSGVLLLSWSVAVRRGGSRWSQGNTNDTKDHPQIEQDRVDRDWCGMRSLPDRALYPPPLAYPPHIVRVDEPSCGRNRQGQHEDPAHGQELPDRFWHTRVF